MSTTETGAGATAEVVSVANDQPKLTTAADENGSIAAYRRGSLAASEGGQGGNVASAVPSRLRMASRSATAAASQPTVNGDTNGTDISHRERSDSTDDTSPMVSSFQELSSTPDIRTVQWESRVTLDGRTYFCNIFTDQTVWQLTSASAEGSNNNDHIPELAGDEATLVYVALVIGQQKRQQSHQRPAIVTGDLPSSVTAANDPYGFPGTGPWSQLAATVALAAFSLASAAGHGTKHECLPLLSQVVNSSKRLLLAAASGVNNEGGGGVDGPIFRSHRVLRDGHREILERICALTLSAKTVSTVWPPPDAADAVHADVAELVRVIRQFSEDAELAGIPVRESAVADDAVALLPGVELDDGHLRAASRSSKHLSTLQRNEQTGATVLVKSDGGAGGESLFARDRTGIRQRLRQHLADHHQRTSGKATDGGESNNNHSASTPETSPDPRAGATATSSSASAATPAADVLQQLSTSSHELARVMLALDRYLRKIERFYVDEETNGSSSNTAVSQMRGAADARLVAYAKHLVAALAVFLQVLDDFDSYSSAVVSAAISDDSAATQNGPAALVVSSMDGLRASRSQANGCIGRLVAATQDFAEWSTRYSNGEKSTNSREREDGQADPEIPSSEDDGSASSSPGNKIIEALGRISDSLQALNHGAMALHINAKRAVEACDICDLRVLWLRVSKYYSPLDGLVSVPAGPTDAYGLAVDGREPTTGEESAYGRRLRHRSLSLPQIRRIMNSTSTKGESGLAVNNRPRADTVDASEGSAPRLARRLNHEHQNGSGSSDDLDSAGEMPLQIRAHRDARAKDKLSRFFGDDPSQYPLHGKRPSNMDDLSISVAGTMHIGGGSSMRTPTRSGSGYADESGSAGGAGSIVNGTGSIRSGHSSNAPSSKAVSTSTAMSPVPQDQNPWYLGYDSSPEEMLLSNDGQVKGSTLPALIERLVAHDVSDPNFVSTFLLTYHSFTTTPELFDGLFKRFMIRPPSGLSDHELSDWTERKLKPVRLRVYNFFKTWLEQHYVEQVEGDPMALEMLREFACTTMAEYMSNAAEQLVRLIDKRRASQGGLRKMVPNLPHAAPAPILPRSLSRLRLMDIHPQEMARQFTLIDSNLFNKVRPIECLKTAWSRKPGDPKAFNGLNSEIATNVKAMSTLSTQTTLWVTANILLEHEIKRRAAVIKYFIAFAEQCRLLNNFNTLMSVLGALTSVPVERLTRTWQAVHQKSLAAYDQLKKIMRTDRNFAEYRDSLHSCNPPAIPFVGVYLQDLTFIEDGNDDMIHSTPGLINFGKRQRTAGTIRDLQQFQNVPYNLTPVAEIQDWLLKRLEELCPNGQSSDRLVEEFWKMSTTLEPKEKDSERVLRLLKESGFL